jgi:transposase
MTKIAGRYSRDFKVETVRLLEASGKSAHRLERELGIGKGCVLRWKRELASDGENAFPGHGRLTPEQEELRRLKRENEILRQERDILKKAIAIFSERKP